MKYYILLLSLCSILFAEGVLAQKPKPAPSEKPPTQKELEEMMKDMQKAINEISPQDKKTMDSLGIKMPNLKATPKIDANSGELLIPKKDAARIAAANKRLFNKTTALPYLAMVFDTVKAALGNEITAACEDLFQTLKSEHKNPGLLGNAAIGCLLYGKNEASLYVMARAIQDMPEDYNQLNNYASMLAMYGGEQFGIPVLNYLNTLFPKNSTVLNNLGQAWFGLGDIPKAEKYLDSTIRIYANHSQANLTKSHIEESKGNKKAAAESVIRSIKEAYTGEKEARLNKLGYDLDPANIPWNRPMPQDALGLDKFERPPYPKNLEESAVFEPAWDQFVAECDAEISRLGAIQDRQVVEMEQAKEVRKNLLLQAKRERKPYHPFPWYAETAMRKLSTLVEDDNEKMAVQNEAFMGIVELKQEQDQIYSTELATIKSAADKGGGTGCEAAIQAGNKYLAVVNSRTEMVMNDYLSVMKRKLNNQVYYDQYTTWPDEFEVSKTVAKMQWLGFLKGSKPAFQSKAFCENIDPPGQARGVKLRQFDDFNCQYKSEINLLVGKIRSECSMLYAELDIYLVNKIFKVDLIKAKWSTKQGDRDDETFMEQFQTASVELGIKETVGFGSGPLRAEAKVGVSGFLEFDRNGVRTLEARMSGEVKLVSNIIRHQEGNKSPKESVYTDDKINSKDPNGFDLSMGPLVKDQGIGIGAEGVLTIVGGWSVHAEGKGLLKGLKSEKIMLPKPNFN